MMAKMTRYKHTSYQVDINKFDDEDGELHSDLDDEDDEEPETDNLVLCQFEKVGQRAERCLIAR